MIKKLDLLAYKRTECVNCGKILNLQTLICDACGTDYNPKPKCDHIYDHWEIIPKSLECAYDLMFLCQNCGEITKVRCTEGLARDLWRRIL